MCVCICTHDTLKTSAMSAFCLVFTEIGEKLQTGLYIKVIFQRVQEVHGFLLGVVDSVIPSLTASFSSFFNHQFTSF